MEDMLGLWFGFIGIIVGAVITFITEIIIRNKQCVLMYQLKSEIHFSN